MDLSPDLAAAMEAILGKDVADQPVASKWKEIVACLTQAKLARVVKDINCTEFLVHPQNRGNLGLNPHNAHRNGAIIQKVGADLSQLSGATAFEVPVEQCAREAAFHWNRQLVQDMVLVLISLKTKQL